MSVDLHSGERQIVDLNVVCITALGIAGSSLIVPPIKAALADFIAGNMNLGDKSLAYVLSVLLQQRWSTARLILAFTGLILSSVLALFIGGGVDIEKQRSKALDISAVSANSVGGRYKEVYGMTSMSLLLNASKSHWPIGKRKHGYYYGEIVSDQTVRTIVS